MLLRDKYIPLSFDDTNFNKNIIKKLKNLDKNNFDNIIITGSKSSGKYTLAMQLLNHLYGNSIYNKRTTKWIINVNGNDKEIDIVSSYNHYEIFINDKNSYDKNVIIESIKKISENINILTNIYSVIIIKNYHYLHYNIFQTIKFICEKRYSNIKFILLGEGLTNVPKFIKGYFTIIRIPVILIHELNNYFFNICEKENIEITNDEVNKVIIKNNSNLSKIYMELNLFLKDKKYFIYTTILEKKYKSIITLLEKKTIHNILLIRKELYNLTAYNINKIDFIKYIFNYFIKLIDNKLEFIQLTNSILEKINKCYREIIHLEYYLIGILNLL